MIEKVENIIDKINETKEVREIIELRKKLNSNEKYINLMNEFLENKKSYTMNNILDKEIVTLRKELFSIRELNEYLKIQNKLRILSININKILLSILD